MRVLAIDPGYERLGVAVIDGGSLVFSECFQTPSTLPFSDRLLLVGREVRSVIERHAPETLAIEKLYFTSNQKTAMQVAQVIGAVTFIAHDSGLSVYEYTPLQIKSACTGNGRADKRQIMAMLPHLIRIDKEIKHDDEYDAIAVGLTHLAHHT